MLAGVLDMKTSNFGQGSPDGDEDCQEKNRDGNQASLRLSARSDRKYASGPTAEAGFALDGRGTGEAGVLQSHRFLQRSHGVGNDRGS
jgi:hypothetical protein